MKPPSCPYFVTTKGSQEQFPAKRACGSVATVHGSNCMDILLHTLSLSCRNLKRALQINVIMYSMIIL